MVHPPQPFHAGDRQLTQRYYAAETIIGSLVFLGVAAVVARYALPDPGGRPIGIAAVGFGLLILLFALRAPYRATVDPDGTLTFTALTRSVTTNIAAVTRIAVVGGGRARGLAFYFDGTKAKFSNIDGNELARYIIERNPDVEHPRRLGVRSRQ